ncbi:MAG: hypothetical protein IJF27_02795 [Oscillospiraceae bacterium]|nr:hypothetical protein [Oscillospiraceae bacterium]MBQ3048538.1 hypothetical protein [Oscillospiraceae bacterium]MBQ9939665.1 hypothetical protein [Oscillospiraceae bacterium]
MKGFVPKEALSKEGYIIDQRKLGNIFYGKYTSDYNGCGWIAAYNLLKLCGVSVEPEEVRSALENSLRFGGKFGTFPFAIKKYLKKHLSVKMKVRSRKQLKKLCCGKGILLYWTGKSAHNAVFCGCEECKDKIRLLNDVCGKEQTVNTESFLAERMRFPLCLMFEVE